MFDKPPKLEYLSWALVVLWAALIFATAPFVRVLTDHVDGRWGSEAFAYGVAAATVLAAALVAVHLMCGRRSPSSYAVLAGVAGLVVYLTFDLARRSPVEAVHYPQYGILSLLLYRAFAHRVRDCSIYLAATLAGTLVGLLDETIQWLTPGRHFATRDIWLNFTAVALMQVALGFGVRPRIIAGWPGRASLSRICYLSAALAGCLGLVHLNTAEQIAWYAPYIPFIEARQTPMVEYGYLHEGGENIQFRSRLTTQELRSLSRERAVEGGQILDRYSDPESYLRFLSIFTPSVDPFLHEARVHLYSRDVLLERGRDADTMAEQERNFTEAYWENYVLENYFNELLQASSHSWSPDVKSEVRSKVRLDRPFVSFVSHELIVRFTERQLAWLFVGLFTALLVLGAYFGQWRSGRPRGRIGWPMGCDPVHRREHDGGEIGSSKKSGRRL